MKKFMIAACLAIGLQANMTANADDIEPSVVRAESTESEDSLTAVKTESKSAYDRIVTPRTVSARGLMNIHKIRSEYYLEIPDSLLGKPMLLASRVSAISDNSDVIAGQMPRNPLMVEWERDGKKVFLLDAGRNAWCDTTQAISKAFELNYMKPVMAAFPVKAVTQDSSAVLIDVSEFFCSDKDFMSPFVKASAYDALTGRGRLKGSFRQNMSSILSFKSFPDNIVFKTRMVYTVSDEPFTAIVTVSMVRLPDSPMKPRLYDRRIGYFTDRFVRYSENADRSEIVSYITRWNLSPRPEDMGAYLAGGLVEPEKPIVYYVDDAFPEKWKKYVKAGIEDWQQAFEQAGFKNAIVARDYPDDPDFDPDDIRFSCVRYASTRVANAMGPSWTDPRSGEIIHGSVYFYHDVLKLLHNWRFVQTAAVDPAARKKVFDEKTMGELIRYVIVHEIGHTLGLKHNMRSSYAYPVDSLRSPSFTSAHGTTPSVMDYARCNYVAQPEDGVTWLLPPILGPYDKYAINWGYRLIPGASAPEDEKPVLDRWIREKGDDPVYRFGEQEISVSVDPASQSESVGDDAVLASMYGIRNLKTVMSRLVEWTAEEGEDYSYTGEMYREVLRQFGRYMGHCMKYIGGNYLQYPVYGDGKPVAVPVPREKQEEALDFIMKSLRELPQWMLSPEIIAVTGPGNDPVYDYQASCIRKLLAQAGRVGYTSKRSDDPYTQYEYMDDLYRKVFRKTLAGRKPDRSEMNMEYAFVQSLIETVKPASGRVSDISAGTRTISFGILKRLQATLEKRVRPVRNETTGHYAYLLNEIRRAVAGNQ